MVMNVRSRLREEVAFLNKVNVLFFAQMKNTSWKIYDVIFSRATLLLFMYFHLLEIIRKSFTYNHSLEIIHLQTFT